MKQLRKANLEALAQIEDMIMGLQRETSDPDCAIYADSGIGRHVRHVLDHYAVFRQGILAGQIDYNERTRNSQVERSAGLALSLIAELKSWMATCSDLASKPLKVLSEVSSLETINVTIDSNLERELHYLAYHTIHHVAYCVLLAKQQGKMVAADIGLAPATATYNRYFSGNLVI